MKNNRGFSLLELLIVVAIILVIATIALPNLLRSRQAAQESSAVAQIRTLNSAEVTYLSSNHLYGDIPSLITQGLIDSRFASVISGYSFTVTASGTSYTLNADPTSVNNGRFGYYSVPDGVIRFATYQGGNCSPCYPGGLSGSPVQ